MAATAKTKPPRPARRDDPLLEPMGDALARLAAEAEAMNWAGRHEAADRLRRQAAGLVASGQTHLPRF